MEGSHLINFVSYEHFDDACFCRVCTKFLEPGREALKRGSATDVINENYTLTSTVVRWGQSTKPLTPSSIPNGQFH